MEVTDGSEELIEIVLGFAFGKSFFAVDEFEEGSAGSVFHEQEKVFVA